MQHSASVEAQVQFCVIPFQIIMQHSEYFMDQKVLYL